MESCPWLLWLKKLEQLERLRSEDTHRRPMITHTIDHKILQFCYKLNTRHTL